MNGEGRKKAAQNTFFTCNQKDVCVWECVCVRAGRNCIQHATHQMSNFQNGNCLKTKTFQKFALNKTQYILAAEKGQKPFVSGCVIERKNILGAGVERNIITNKCK